MARTGDRRRTFEPAGSHPVGTPPADLVSTAGSNAPHAEWSPEAPVGDTGSAGGVGGERGSARGRSPLCGGAGAEPPHSGAPPSAPSSLDTKDITRSGERWCVRNDAKWLNEIGERTEDHRSAKRRKLRAIGRERFEVLLAQGVPASEASARTEWHKKRAEAQATRIQRVEDCGATDIVVECPCCGFKLERPSGCRIGLLCLRCRGKSASIKRARFLASRLVALAEAKQRGLLNPKRRNGRWSEKLLTLTVPHVSGDTVSERVGRCTKAWTQFLRRLNRHWRKQDAASAQFFRCLEWTPGDDGAGHPHIHAWLFCPFLPGDEVRGWWREALFDAGLEPSFDQKLVLDLREITSPKGGVQELIKYLTKDIDAQGDKIAPEIYAEVYKSFDGRRVTQASRGFMSLGERESRCSCGTDLPRRITVRAKERASETPSAAEAK